jgi:hypothetical protein
MGNRVLYDETRVRALFASMREELRQMGERHAVEVAVLRRELDGVRAAFAELRSVTLARGKAEQELADLRRLRDIGRAQAAERDPNVPLN